VRTVGGCKNTICQFWDRLAEYGIGADPLKHQLVLWKAVHPDQPRQQLYLYNNEQVAMYKFQPERGDRFTLEDLSHSDVIFHYRVGNERKHTIWSLPITCPMAELHRRVEQ
jgi:hypothetical protein